MPDHNEVMGRIAQIVPKTPSVGLDEIDYHRYAEKGAKAKKLLQDPLWGVLIEELGECIVQLEDQIAAIEANIFALDDCPDHTRMMFIRQRDQAIARLQAFKDVVECCDNLVEEGESANLSLLSTGDSD